MQLRKGSARVPRAIDGVSPSISLNHICSPFGDKICETKFAARRRKLHARGVCSPFHLHRSGLVLWTLDLGPWTCKAARGLGRIGIGLRILGTYGVYPQGRFK